MRGNMKGVSTGPSKFAEKKGGLEEEDDEF